MNGSKIIIRRNKDERQENNQGTRAKDITKESPDKRHVNTKNKQEIKILTPLSTVGIPFIPLFFRLPPCRGKASLLPRLNIFSLNQYQLLIKQDK
jgi:hypothetical protein